MAKKATIKTKSVNAQLSSLEKLVRSGFKRTDARFAQIDGRFKQIDGRLSRIEGSIKLLELDQRSLRKDMNERFEFMEVRFNQLFIHVDGFMKLHETLAIEFKVIKEQMNRLEERLTRLEHAGVS